MLNCRKCGEVFEPQKGLRQYCSLKCRNSRSRIKKEFKKANCVECGTNIEVGKRANLQRCKCTECRKLVKKTSEWKERPRNTLVSERMKKQWLNDSYRNHMIAKLREYNLNPDIRAKKQALAKSRTVTESTKEKLRRLAIERNLGGHTSKVKITYKKKDGSTVYLQSSYEIQVAKEFDKYEVQWIRPGPLKWVDSNGVLRRYYADFYLPNWDVFLDTKNDYLIEKDRDKITRVKLQNEIKILILSKKELTWEVIKKLL